MADGRAKFTAPGARARLLAAWTKLGKGRFGDCYKTAAPFDQPNWAAILGMKHADPVLAACLLAEGEDFLDGLAEAVAKWERDRRTPAAVADMLATVTTHGVMQGMTDQQKGFMSADILPMVTEASEACAIVEQDDPVYRQLGTAFLVRPDLVLTAGHVALDTDAAGWAMRLKPGLTFRFRARRNGRRSEMVPIRAASGDRALVSASLPNGAVTGALNPSLDPPAEACLDFALIRLAQRVEYITPVDIVDTAEVKEGRPCWAFGYIAGSALNFDVDRVTDVNAAAGRWLHTANTDRGMSGGCCINHLGQVAGIHEGAIDFQEKGVAKRRNRGVSIAAIRRMQCSAGKDPLKQLSTTPGVQFYDPTLVEGLYRAGVRLGGPALAAGWREQFVTALGGLDPEAGAAMPPFHPWFEHAGFRDWVDSARSANRLCLIHGGPGTGKSFCARILAERLPPAGNDLLALSPTQVTGMDWADAISPVLVPEPARYRTAAAAARYRDITEFIAVLRGRIADSGRVQHVVLDFGPAGDTTRFIGTSWIKLVLALAATDSIRVTVIGLDEDERITLTDLIESDPATRDVSIADIELMPISRNDLRAYAERLADARGVTLLASDLRARIDAGLPREMQDSPAGRAFQTVSAALTAIALERSLQ